MAVLQVPHYEPAPCTKADLDYADLPVIDLSKAATKSGQQELATKVRAALVDHGVFYAINHGYTSEQTTRMTNIANILFSNTTDEEKIKYLTKIQENGSFQGYKMRKYWWRKGRTMAYGKDDEKTMERKDNGVDVELINGIPVSHYN